MRRRFGIPLTILLLALAAYAQTQLGMDVYYWLVGVTAVLAAVDAYRLKLTDHGASQLMSPVGILASMAIAWPIMFPWYLKVRYHVARGESADKAGSGLAIRLGFLGVFAVIAGGVYLVMYMAPDIKNLFFLSRDMSEAFGKSVQIADNNSNGKREMVLTLNTTPSKDAATNERFARKVANFARARYPKADSLTAIEVVLQEEVVRGAIRIKKEPVRFKWTLAQLRDSSTASRTNLASASVTAPTVTPAGSPSRPNRGAPPKPATASMVTTTTAPAPAPARASTRSAYSRLAAADPAVRWVTDSAMVADIDCDHRADTVVVGRRRAEIHVGLARAATPEPQILIFDVGRGTKGVVCSTRATLSLESLDFDPAERGLASLDGFRRSTSCKGVGLGDGDCRTAHIFWSEKTQHLEWYQ